METNLPIRLRDHSELVTTCTSTRNAVEDLRLRPSDLRHKLIEYCEDVSEDELEAPSSSVKLQRLIDEAPPRSMDMYTPPNMTESALEVYRLRQALPHDSPATQGAASSSEDAQSDSRSPFIAYWEDVSDGRLKEAASSLKRQRYISGSSLSTRMNTDTPPNMTKWALDYYNTHERGNARRSLADLPESSEKDTWAPVDGSSTEAAVSRFNELKNRRSDEKQSDFLPPWQRLDGDLPRASSSDTKNVKHIQTAPERQPSFVATPTMSSPAASVFGTTELLELILLKLPTSHLPFAAHVSPQWRDLMIASSQLRSKLLAVSDEVKEKTHSNDNDNDSACNDSIALSNAGMRDYASDPWFFRVEMANGSLFVSHLGTKKDAYIFVPCDRKPSNKEEKMICPLKVTTSKMARPFRQNPEHFDLSFWDDTGKREVCNTRTRWSMETSVMEMDVLWQYARRFLSKGTEKHARVMRHVVGTELALGGRYNSTEEKIMARWGETARGRF